MKIEEDDIETDRVDLLKSIGGQVQVFCRCNSFPLMLSCGEKRDCMNNGCSNKEKFSCCNLQCSVRLCNKCFQKHKKSKERVYCDPLPTLEKVKNEFTTAAHATMNDSSSSSQSSDDDSYLSSNDDDSMMNSDKSEEDSEVETSLRSRLLELKLTRSAGDEFDASEMHDEDEFFLQDFVTFGNYNPMDKRFPCESDGDNSKSDVEMDDNDSFAGVPEYVPVTSNAGNVVQDILPRNRRSVVPFHVLLNQAGTVCKRHDQKITGTMEQQNFVQRLVSNVVGTSIPLIYPEGMTQPRHFYAQATRDSHAILGAIPLSCYTSNPLYPHGVACSLANTRVHCTHSSSSISTCHTAMAFDYDQQCNKVAGSLDSRLINRNGFIVDVVNKHGIYMRDAKRTELNHGVDSHQTALDLAATQLYHNMDWFLTFTLNQAKHPGIKHLYLHKESLAWTEFIPRYQHLSQQSKAEVKQSFEQAYGNTVGRCWLEVSRLLLDHVTNNPIIFGAPVDNVFWRYEYQETVGNMFHIHGLLGLNPDFMADERRRKFVYDLQKCDLANLLPTKDIQQFIKEGLLEDEQDWHVVGNLGNQILRHVMHSEHCLERYTDEAGEKGLRCRHFDVAKESVRPLEHEFKPFKFDFSLPCLSILAKCGLYDWPSPGKPRGVLKHPMLIPKRHIGRITPGCPDKMSPVISRLFAGLRSMQNAQVLTNTGGVARYVVKYVTALDQGNRTVVWADPHSGAKVLVDKHFLHNPKISRSNRNEQKIFEKSRQYKHPLGRTVSPMEMLQQMLGVPEVITTFEYVHIATTSLEFRPTTSIELDSKGNLQRRDKKTQDWQQASSDATVMREQMHEKDRTFRRIMTVHQNMLFQHNGTNRTKYDKLTEFGLRPVELLQLFPRVGNYFRWFHTDSTILTCARIRYLLKKDITKCAWIDGFGRQVWIRYRAFKEVLEHLQSIDDTTLNRESKNLMHYLFGMISTNKQPDMFVLYETDQLPVPVFSSVTPRDPVPFLHHIMIVLGDFETELDFSMEPTLRDSFVKLRLIGPKTDMVSLKQYISQLTVRVMHEIMRAQPLTMRRMNDHIITVWQMLKAVILRNEIPTSEIPPCLLTDMLNQKEEQLKGYWKEVTSNIVGLVYNSVPDLHKFPTKASMEECTKLNPLEWDVLDAFDQFQDQSTESYAEQRYVIELGKIAVDKYLQVFGPKATVCTRNMIIHGVPGAGKTYLALLIGLYGISKGLRVMTTSIMAARAVAVGGIHIHKLGGFHSNVNITPFRLAELALEKLHRKSQLKYLYLMKTMDVLIFDEIFQASAQRISALDIVLKTLRNSDLPFGGVLVIGPMDPQQFPPIDGLPFLLSSLVITMFTMVELRHSVRAAKDEKFKELQNIIRMSPNKLVRSKKLKEQFFYLCREVFTFVNSWKDKKITPDTLRLYSRRKPVQEALNQYVCDTKERFNIDGTPFLISHAEDFQQVRRSEFRAASNTIF